MNTINETTRLCKENGIGISRNHLRYLASSGSIPSVKIGNKILINWDKLIEYLNTHKLEPVDTSAGIRKISA